MDLKRIIQKNNFRFQKRFGQNFISDDTLLEDIVDNSGVDKNTAVLEIGVGGATLTRAIARKAKCVYGYEIDKNLQGVIAESLAGVENATVIFRDFMREKMSDVEDMLGEDYVVIANLPYYITTPIIMRFIEEAKRVLRIVVMVQEEVGDRICAKENTKDYGAITAMINLVATSSVIKRVPRETFFPSPNVDSCVVKIDINRNKYAGVNHLSYRRAVKMAFLSRRKTICNNLMLDTKLKRTEAESILSECKIDVSCRGETLGCEDFIRLSEKLEEKGIY